MDPEDQADLAAPVAQGRINQLERPADPEDQAAPVDLEAQAVQADPADQVILVKLKLKLILNNYYTYSCSWL